MYENYEQNAYQSNGCNQIVPNQSAPASMHPSQVPSTTDQNQLAPEQTTPSGNAEVAEVVETLPQFGYPCAGNSYGNFYQLSQEDQRRLVVEHLRAQRRMEEQFYMHQENLRYEADKQLIKDVSAEARRERQRAQYQEIVCGADGKLYAITLNTLKPAQEREAFNFQHAKLFRLVSSSGEAGVFLLLIKINGKETEIFLDEQKSENNRYIMKKIRGVGGDFLARKKADKEELASGLWKYLKSQDCPVLTIPADIGWMQSEKGITFVREEALTWKKIKNSLN